MLTVTLSLIVLCQLTADAIGTRLPLEVYEIPQSSTITSHQQQVFEGNSNYLKQKPISVDISSGSNPLDRRRSRQMFDLLQRQQHHQIGQNVPRNHHQKAGYIQPKILYQIGESEEDLPICAPNAVCSKIDLYETPWIERQCRCEDINRIPSVILHHRDPYLNHESLHNFYESEKLHKRKRILDYSESSRQFDIHIKKLLVGSVYDDESDFDSDEDTLEIQDNELPIHHTSYKSPSSNRATHMRHTGHSNAHRSKEISYIGGCPSSLGIDDGHTIVDKTRHYKLCNPVHKLPVCRHFRDYTWTLTTSSETNVTEQIVHCRCPRNSVTYLTKREPQTDGVNGYTYLFACSPLTRIRCQRKEPCKLFTVRKRQEFLDEVNINALCQCPKGHHCPSHHTNSGVIPGESFVEENIQTYSGYCMAND